MIPVDWWFGLASVEDGVDFLHFFPIMDDDIVELLHHQLVDRVSRSIRINLESKWQNLILVGSITREATHKLHIYISYIYIYLIYIYLIETALCWPVKPYLYDPNHLPKTHHLIGHMSLPVSKPLPSPLPQTPHHQKPNVLEVE